MPYPPKIALVGPMGVGKTTFGKTLAKALGYQLIDMDAHIEQRTRQRIPELFAEHGEAVFRRHEAVVLRWALKQTQVVIATGGGCILRPDNRQRLKQHAFTIYMTLPEPRLWERLQNNQHRPLLQVPNPRARLKQLLAERDPYYQQVAKLKVSRPDVAELLNQIIQAQPTRA